MHPDATRDRVGARLSGLLPDALSRRDVGLRPTGRRERSRILCRRHEICRGDGRGDTNGAVPRRPYGAGYIADTHLYREEGRADGEVDGYRECGGIWHRLCGLPIRRGKLRMDRVRSDWGDGHRAGRDVRAAVGMELCADCLLCSSLARLPILCGLRI